MPGYLFDRGRMRQASARPNKLIDRLLPPLPERATGREDDAVLAFYLSVSESPSFPSIRRWTPALDRVRIRRFASALGDRWIVGAAAVLMATLPL